MKSRRWRSGGAWPRACRHASSYDITICCLNLTCLSLLPSLTYSIICRCWIKVDDSEIKDCQNCQNIMRTSNCWDQTKGLNWLYQESYQQPGNSKFIQLNFRSTLDMLAISAWNAPSESVTWSYEMADSLDSWREIAVRYAQYFCIENLAARLPFTITTAVGCNRISELYFEVVHSKQKLTAQDGQGKDLEKICSKIKVEVERSLYWV